MKQMTRSELEATDYGRGAARFITGARYAVVTNDPTSWGRLYHVISTHRTESAATKRLRQQAQNTGRVQLVEIA